MTSPDHTDSRRIFAEAFQRYGPPTTAPDDLPSSCFIPYDVRAFFPDIYCDYVDSDDLNAMACIYKGHELVALFTGLIHFMNPYYAAFLSDPAMFQDIGDPSKDSHTEELKALRIEYLKEYPTLGFAPLSVCKTRSRAIIRLISCAHLFLHAHEVAHIVLGHLDLLRDEFGMSTYEELPVAPLSVEEANLRRALELQADQSAALTSLHLFRKQFEEQSDNEEFMNADRLWAIAVESLFMLLQVIMSKKGIRRPMTHPSAFTRWLNVKFNVQERAEEHGIRSLRVPEVGPSVTSEVRDWLTNNGLANDQWLSVDNDIRNKIVDELYSTWEMIAPYEERLERYRALRGNRAVKRVPS